MILFVILVVFITFEKFIRRIAVNLEWMCFRILPFRARFKPFRRFLRKADYVKGVLMEEVSWISDKVTDLSDTTL